MKNHNGISDSDRIVLESTRLRLFMDELLAEVTNPLHKRILLAYREYDPVNSMENELGKILMEVLGNED